MSFSSSSSGTATPTPEGTEVPPVGFGFHPTDPELINSYLGPKNRGEDDPDRPVLPDVELCKFEPWDLPGRYFYGRRELKFKKSNRSNRATKEGYWKSDGNARPIKAKRTKEVIGSKRTLVFHLGRPKGKRTKWVMHEYECSPDSGSSNQEDFVLYKLKNKSDEKDTKHDAYYQTVLNPEIESPELAEMASLSSHGICEQSHLMSSGSYNKNQEMSIIGAPGEIFDANSVESSPMFDYNMGPLSVTNCLQSSSQMLPQPPKSTMPNSHTQIYPMLPSSNTSPCHYQNNGIVEVVLSQLSSQTPKTTLQTSNIQNSDSFLAIKTSLCHYQNNDITEVALSSQTPITTLQISNIQTFDSLSAINSSLCHYQSNDISEVTSFDPKTQANATDGYSISPSQSAILSGTVVNSTHDVADSLMVSDFENQNSDNQDGISSASVERAWSSSMAASYTDYGTQNQYENFDMLYADGLLASDLESKNEEPEENSEFSSELWGASLDSMLEQYHMVNSPLWMPIHSDEGPSSVLFPPECDSTLRPSPLCL